jgi:hypothetical protein
MHRMSVQGRVNRYTAGERNRDRHGCGVNRHVLTTRRKQDAQRARQVQFRADVCTDQGGPRHQSAGASPVSSRLR